MVFELVAGSCSEHSSSPQLMTGRWRRHQTRWVDERLGLGSREAMRLCHHKAAARITAPTALEARSADLAFRCRRAIRLPVQSDITVLGAKAGSPR